MGRAKTIEPVRPSAGYCHYFNQASQGSLLKATAGWPRGRQKALTYRNQFDFYNCQYDDRDEVGGTATVPNGMDIDSAYVDRMLDWDRDKMQAAVKHLRGGCGMTEALRSSSDEQLIAFVNAYFDVDATAVRTIFYYNVATGYPCERIDYLYRPKANVDQVAVAPGENSA